MKVPEQVTKFAERRRSVTRQIAWRFDQRVRRRRHLKQTEQIRQKTDDEDNARVAFPEDEKVLWPCFWLAEVFAPSHASALETGLEKLEKGSSSTFLRFEDPSAWLRRSRAWTGGYWNVGEFINGETLLGRRQRAGLPEDFQYAQGSLRQIAPGITVVVMQFVLDEAHWTCLEDVMRRRFRSRATPLRGHLGGHQVTGPEHGKEDALGALREHYRALARDWFSDRLPGLFSSLSEDAPAWDFLVTNKFPLSTGGSDYSDQWRETLGFGAILEHWRTDDLAGLHVLQPNREGRCKAVSSVVALEHEGLSLLEGQHMGAGLSGLTHLVDRPASDLTVVTALRAAFEAHERRFARIRDELGAPPAWGRSGGRLRRLRREVMPLAFDLQTLGNLAANNEALALRFRQSGAEFMPVDAVRNGHQIRWHSGKSLLETTVASIKARGVRVAEQGKDISEAIRIQGELLLAANNIQLQRLVLALTVVVGAAGIYVTATN